MKAWNPNPEDVLWTLHKGDRTAEARIGTVAIGVVNRSCSSRAIGRGGELRIGNIAALESKHLDADLTWIRIAHDKTAGHTGRSLVTPIVPTLRVALQAAKKAAPKGAMFVVELDAKEVRVRARRIQDALRTAGEVAGVLYGVEPGHVTFHSLRHTAAT